MGFLSSKKKVTGTTLEESIVDLNKVLKGERKDKVNNVLKIQDNSEKVVLNIGGKKYMTSTQTINESKYKNNIFKLYLKNLSNKNNINDTIEIFIDRSFTDFQVIYDILKISNNKYFIDNDYTYIGKISNNEIFIEDLNYYFRTDFETIIEDFKLQYLLKNNCYTNLLNNFEVEDQNNEKTIDYMQYRIKNIEEVKFPFCQKGIFVNEKGSILFTLSEMKQINKIEVKPFIYDKHVWDHLKCEGLKVYISYNKKTWMFVGGLYFQNINLHNSATIEMQNSSVLYIKITSGRFKCPFAISHIGLYGDI